MPILYSELPFDNSQTVTMVCANYSFAGRICSDGGIPDYPLAKAEKLMEK
jgi:hypothetical protein